MLGFVGDQTEEIIEFPNGMCIKIDFGDINGPWFGGIRPSNLSTHRRVRLFDKDKRLIGEKIEENPNYIPGPPPEELFKNHDPKVIF